MGFTEAWRKRRATIVHPSKPTYDAYPGEDEPPEIRFYLEARDVRGRLLREYVYLADYSVSQINWKQGMYRGGVLVRDWFIGQMLEAMIRLQSRLDVERETKMAKDNEIHRRSIVE